METIKLNKSRSIKASIVEAWHVLALDWRKYLKQIALPAVAAGMAGAFVFEIGLQCVCKNILPAYRLYRTGADVSWVRAVMIPSWVDLSLLLLSLVVLLFFSAYYKGKLLGIIDRFAEKGIFDDRPTVGFTAEESTMAKKNIAMKIFFIAVFLLLCTLIVWASVQLKMAFLYLLPVVIVYFWTTGNVARLQYVNGKYKFFQAIKQGLKKSLGYAFLVQILTFIPMLLLYAVFLLPAVVYALSAMAAEDSMLVGDAAVVSDLLPFAFFVLNTIGIASALLFNSVRTWSLVMKLNIFVDRGMVSDLDEESAEE